MKGFTLESLSMATHISLDTLTQIINDPSYLPEDYNDYHYLFTFFGQLYQVSPLDPFFVFHIVEGLTTYFKISHDAIANHINISTNELLSFIKAPEGNKDRHDIELRLMHLFTTFVRDRRFSVD